MNYQIVPLEPSDRKWVKTTMIREWDAEFIIVHHKTFHPHLQPGFKAVYDGEITGLVTFYINRNDCEILTLNSFHPGVGIGEALIQAVETTALSQGCLTCTLVTTNDNLIALRFYQKRDYRITEIRHGAVDESRKLKPEIPLFSENGIPVRDEITLRKQIH